MNTVRKNVTIYSIYWYTIQLYSVTTYFFCCCDDNKIKLARKPGKKQKAEIDPTRLGLLPSVETAFKLLFGTKWIQVIPKHQTHIHDKNVSLFPTAIAEFKMLHLILLQRKFVIEFMIKHDSNKVCRFKLYKTFFIQNRRKQ